jgi:phage FluMu protein gp41
MRQAWTLTQRDLSNLEKQVQRIRAQIASDSGAMR